MIEYIKDKKQFKKILLDWTKNKQFACFNIRIYRFVLTDLEDEDRVRAKEFVGWWYGIPDMGQSVDDDIHFEMRIVIKNGGMFIVPDGVHICSSNFSNGFWSSYPSDSYCWQADGESVKAIFNNAADIGPDEKIENKYYLEITPLATLNTKESNES